MCAGVCVRYVCVWECVRERDEEERFVVCTGVCEVRACVCVCVCVCVCA